MAWTLETNSEEGFIKLVYTGTVTPAELRESFDVLVARSAEMGITKVLTDCRQMTGGHGIFDLLELVALFPPKGAALSFRDAIIAPTDERLADDARFFETACLNRGYDVRLFCAQLEATQWLRDGAHPQSRPRL